MSRASLAASVRETSGKTAAASHEIVGAMLDTIADDLKATGRFSLAGFGTFLVRQTKARRARNPRTGERVQVKASATVRFKPSPALKRLVGGRVAKPRVRSSQAPQQRRRAA